MPLIIAAILFAIGFVFLRYPQEFQDWLVAGIGKPRTRMAAQLKRLVASRVGIRNARFVGVIAFVSGFGLIWLVFFGA